MFDRNLLLRVASAAVGLPILIAVILAPSALPFALFALAAGIVALSEYTRLVLPDRGAAERGAATAIGAAFGAGLYLWPWAAHALAIGAVIVAATATLWFSRDVQGAAARFAGAGFGALYVGALLAALPLLKRDVSDGALWVILAIGATFMSDTGAYFVGRAVGRHKLAPVISPGKTVEGGVGGFAAALGGAFAARATFFPGLTAADCLALGAFAGILGPVGDLTESMLKRAAGVKDSGWLIPGHGGMLDRIDAVLFVGAATYVWVVHLR